MVAGLQHPEESTDSIEQHSKANNLARNVRGLELQRRVFKQTDKALARRNSVMGSVWSLERWNEQSLCGARPSSFWVVRPIETGTGRLDRWPHKQNPSYRQLDYCGRKVHIGSARLFAKQIG